MASTLSEQAVTSRDYADGYRGLDRDCCREFGKALAQTHQAAEPFLHELLPDLLRLDVLRRIDDEFPCHEPGRLDDAQSRLKTGCQLEKIQRPLINNVRNALNSAPFPDLLEAMTGIKGLVPHPFPLGGGLHETCGEHLSIHADWNMHPRLRLERRLNLVLFMNENWDEQCGANLERWERDMPRCARPVTSHMGNGDAV